MKKFSPNLNPLQPKPFTLFMQFLTKPIHMVIPVENSLLKFLTNFITYPICHFVSPFLYMTVLNVKATNTFLFLWNIFLVILSQIQLLNFFYTIQTKLHHWKRKCGPSDFPITDRCTEYINRDMTHLLIVFILIILHVLHIPHAQTIEVKFKIVILSSHTHIFVIMILTLFSILLLLNLSLVGC